MKAVVILIVCIAFAINTCYAETYDTKYDNIDIDEILSNDRVLASYVRCLLDKGPCTKEGRLLKHDLPDAINTNCGKCTEAQKKIVRKASRHMMERKPDEWKTLQAKFDPESEHVEDFKKFISDE